MKKSISTAKLRVYLWIAIAWLSLWLLSSLVNSTETFFASSLNEVWKALFVSVLNFILLEYSLPIIQLNWKRILLGLLLIWLHGMMYSFGLHGWIELGSGLSIYTVFRNIPTVTETMAYSTTSAFFFGIIIHVHDHLQLKQRSQRLQIEKQEAELNFLKSQTNPHFLFNTLNNIYSLAIDKSELAPESILRLSKILRFMLYNTGDPFIRIEKEIMIIRDYIALERLRYDDSFKVNFKHDIEDMELEVPPLLLIPLVENAFKHGISETRSEPFIDIRLSVSKWHLQLVVQNSAEAPASEEAIKENIGLSNLRRQLQILYNDHSLSLKRVGAEFTAVLNINLASHV